MQLDQPKRGFSFQQEGPLDMRMDQDELFKAEDVVNRFSVVELEEIFRLYGEERRAKSCARAIDSERKKESIKTTSQLARLIERVYRGRRGKRQHPATRVFQALRIFVNRELEAIQQGVREALLRLSRGGILATLSFHSLEDRIVKNLFREMSTGTISIVGNRERREPPAFRLVKSFASSPSLAEVTKNRRARSAKLRACEKY